MGSNYSKNDAAASSNIVVINSNDPAEQAEAQQHKRDRYRPASAEAIAYNNLTNVQANKVVQAEMRKQGLDPSIPQANEFDEKGNIKFVGGPSQQTSVKDTQQYIVEQEGLMIGDEKRRMLSQQWRFVLSSDPLQRGIDAGVIAAAVTAVGLCAFSKKMRRQPGKVSFLALMGFVAGTLSVPLAAVYLDSQNMKRIQQRDAQAMLKQRDEYHEKRRNGEL